MRKSLCYLATSFPTLLIGGVICCAVLALFSVVLTVCFLGFACILYRSIEQGREENWYGMSRSRKEASKKRTKPSPRRAVPDRRYHYT